VSARSHGLVLGKFYPPHLGHDFLIRAASSSCDVVTVLVLARDDEAIDVATRVAWLRSNHAQSPNVRVIGALDNNPTDFDNEDLWTVHMRVIRSALEGAGDAVSSPSINLVFSSEPYGVELARRFAARHVLVDPGRLALPISATMIRANPVAQCEFLSPIVRASMAKRVVILGAESTGSTTLTTQLALAYRQRVGFERTSWVPEFGHEFGRFKLLRARALADGVELPASRDLVWSDDDFEAIARRQNADEDNAARDTGLLLLCDTDSWATGLWQERYLGQCSDAVRALSRSDRALYIVTSPEGVPFAQDGTRDGEELRDDMHQRFIDGLTKSNQRFVVVAGSPEKRRDASIRAIDAVVAEGWGWSA
jgi:HTH-type transcriptional repressor of NAD biosynthesis genes